MTWKHNDLAGDLACHLRGPARMVWADIQLGPSGSPRPDVYTLMKSFSKPKPTAYEIKVSRSDFLADVTAGKWMQYLAYAESVTFCAPAGLLKKDEIPATCGFMERGEASWRTVRRASPSPVTIPQDAMLKLLIDGIGREGGAARMDLGRRYRADKAAAMVLGQAVANQVQNALWADTRIEHAERDAKRIVEQAQHTATRLAEQVWPEAPMLWQDLVTVLGLPRDADTWQVERAIRDVKIAAEGGVAAQQLRFILSCMEGATESLRSLLPKNKCETAREET